MGKIIDDIVLQANTENILQWLADNVPEFESYTDEEIDTLFSLTPEEAQKLTDLIADTVISQYKLWSSKKVNDELTLAKSECNDYTDQMLSNISSITIDYVDALPATGDTSTIYILKATDGSSKDTLNLYNATSGWTVIGDFEISLDNYYNKTEIDGKLDLKADKTEILSQDDVLTDTSLASTTNVLSAKTALDELDKKVNEEKVKEIIDSEMTTKGVCTTKVADVPLTNVPIPDGLFETISTSASYIKYEVVNGIAFVYINIRDAKIIANGISRNITVPKMKNPFNYTTIGESFNNALTFMSTDNIMQIWSLGNTANITSYGCCISYPVAE